MPFRPLIPILDEFNKTALAVKKICATLFIVSSLLMGVNQRHWPGTRCYKRPSPRSWG